MSSNDFSNLIPIGTELVSDHNPEGPVTVRRARVAGHAVTAGGFQAYVLEYGSGSLSTIAVQTVKYVHETYEPVTGDGEAKSKNGDTIRSGESGHVVVVMDGEPDDEGWVVADTTDHVAIIHVGEDN